MRGIGDRTTEGARKRRGQSRSSTIAILVTAAAVLAGCTGTPSVKKLVRDPKSKEYFAESEYGVKASPRVTMAASNLKRGGGRDMIGKPYKIKGKWYKPKEEPNYVKVGGASWYGDAFHGRLTANGEVYDMTHLTAAHPTMPLPSYARVTNQKNGTSIVVRVNDRGPFAKGRVIDLSKRAAEMLDYKHAGVAKVKVEYLGRAPLHGRDDQYLLASYRPGAGHSPRGREELPGINDGMASGVMVAMAGNTPGSGMSLRRRSLFDALPGGRKAPQRRVVQRAPQPVEVASAPQPRSSRLENVVLPDDPLLPDIGPRIPERPTGTVASDAERLALPLLSYADRRVKEAPSPFDSVASVNMSADEIVASWKRAGDRAIAQSNGPNGSYLIAGSFGSIRSARDRAEMLAGLGTPEILRDGDTFTVVITAKKTALDRLAQRAWDAGADDAFIVRGE